LTKSNAFPSHNPSPFSRNGATDLKVIDFRGFRKIGVMEKTDSRILCAQCHVELSKAREKHEEAHVLWEFWTAENSDGFHNPALARDSLARSISASKEGVAMLNQGMNALPEARKATENRK
jgi:hypothetical protein